MPVVGVFVRTILCLFFSSALIKPITCKYLKAEIIAILQPHTEYLRLG